MKILAITLFVLINAIVVAQDVPTAVETSCTKKFPGATDIEWSINQSTYEVNFYHNEESKLAKFDQTGKWLETRTNMDEETLPEAVSKGVNTSYSDSYFESIEKVENNKNEIYYDILLSTDSDYYMLKVSKDGTILHKEKKIYNDDDIYDEE